MVKMETTDGKPYTIFKRDGLTYLMVDTAEEKKVRIIDVYGERGMTSNDVVYKDNHITIFILPKNAKLVDR